MNKQEVIEEIKNLEGLTILDKTINFDSKMISKKKVLNIVKQLDEPEKPVVPQFVADWLEVCKDNLALSLANSMNPIVLRTNNQPEKTIHWFKSTKNQEKFAKAWLFGYEVEKEKLYTVKFSNEDFGKIYIGISKKFNKLGISSLPLNDDEIKSWFTEDELKRFKFWDNPAFEVREVEDDTKI